MTLTDALQYLETTARVSCPQITCDQAREIAELLRDLSDQHQVDIAEMVSWKIHAQVLHERDEAQAMLLHSQICVSGLQAQREESAQSTQIRINLIKIAQEQHMQAHSAIDKLGPFAEGPLAQRIGEVGAAMDSMRVVIDTLRAQLREAERERDGLKEALDVDPNVEWQRRCLIAEKEQNEGWFQFANVSNELSDTRRDHEILRQIACGFAWDAGREMAVAENTAAFWEAQHAAQKRYHRMVAADKAEEVDRLQEQAESLRRQLDAPVEAAPDFDADDYAKPGKR